MVGFRWLTDEDEYLLKKDTKSWHLWSVYHLQGNLPVLRMSLSPTTSGEVWRKIPHQDLKRFFFLKYRVSFPCSAIQITTLSLTSAIEQHKENCMETVKWELFSSQGPAVYLANWSFRALCISSKCQLFPG